MKLLKCLLTANRCYKAGRTIKPKGVMVHSTAAPNPLLRRYVQPVASTPGRAELLAQLGVNKNANDWNREGKWVNGKWVPLQACVHGFIGKLADGSIASVQALPWNHRGWHAGDGSSGRSANDTHISFEICEDGLTDPAYFGMVYREAVELTAILCKEYALDPLADGVVICHQEGCRRGIASNHGDVLHWFPKHGSPICQGVAPKRANLPRFYPAAEEMIEAMQQTDKYKLNKPGPDDPISPLPLNENMDKVEAAFNAEAAARQAALSAETAAREAADAALDGRVTAVNGRVTTVDNRVTAVDGRRVLDHLLTATAPEGADEFTIDLSGFDLTQYGALVVVFGGEEGKQPMILRPNDSNETMHLMDRSSGSSTYSRYYGGGIGLLIPAGNSVYCVSISGGHLPGTHSGTASGILSTPFQDIHSFKILYVGTYAVIALYGLRF